MITYIIPEIPPSNNRFKGRQNHWEYRTVKKEWEQKVWAYCNPKPKAPIPKATVTITYYFDSRRRHDPDNYNGVMILDGLVKSNILKDDCFDCIDLFLKGGYDKANPRTEIVIKEIITDGQPR